MVRCAKCLQTLDCGCAKGKDSNGTSAIEKKPGAIWVHVTDDAGTNIPDLGVIGGFKDTNAKGLAISDALGPKTYPVELAPLSSTNIDKYDLPAVLKHDVTVQNGTIANLDYVLFRKATLEAEFVLRSNDKTRFEGSTIKVNAELSAPWSDAATPSPLTKTSAESDKGLASFGPVSAGEYKLTPDYSALDKREQFDVEEDPQPIKLKPAEAKTAKFHIQQKAQLKVEIICKRPPVTKLPKWYLDDAAVNIKLEPESGKEEKKDTAKGIADFGWLSPGKYNVTPDYSPLDACKYEWKPETKQVTLQPRGNETLIFEVEPIYQKVQFVAHCVLAIPDQVYQDTPEDSAKLNITTATNGKKEFQYKNKQVPTGKTNREDLNSSLASFGTATFKFNFGTSFDLALNPSKVNTKWSIEELEHLWRNVCTIEPVLNKAGYYKVTYKDKFKDVPYDSLELSGGWKAKYHGYPDDKADIDARVSFVKDALTIAHDQTEKDPRVLKVFLLPECFFQGLYGDYLFEDTGYLVTELQKAVGGEEWRDWVFGFGTVNTAFPVNIPYKILPDPGSSTPKPEEVLDMNNHAIVIRGGLGEPGSAARMIQKLVNSAELADDLIRDLKATRTQAVNATVQFGDTVNDNEWIKMLTELWRTEESDGSPGVLFISSEVFDLKPTRCQRTRRCVSLSPSRQGPKSAKTALEL